MVPVGVLILPATIRTPLAVRGMGVNMGRFTADPGRCRPVGEVPPVPDPPLLVGLVRGSVVTDELPSPPDSSIWPALLRVPRD